MLGDLVIAYLFLGGCGAGAGFVASVMGVATGCVGVDRSLQRLVVPSLVVAFFALLVGMFYLYLDLGCPAQLTSLVFSTHVSWGTVGAYALAASIVLCLVQGVATARAAAPAALLRTLQLLTAVACFAVMSYTGMLLFDMSGTPLWHTPLLPLLFTSSALSCGCAITAVCCALFRTDGQRLHVLRVLAKADLLVVVLEALALALFLLGGSQLLFADPAELGTSASAASAASAHGVAASPAAWGVAAVLGCAVPLLADTAALARPALLGREPSRAVLLCFQALCVLAGAVLLRYCVVSAGAHPFLGVGQI